MPLEVYDTESSEWFKFNSLQRFRASTWIQGNNVYVHGGFEHDSPNIPLSEICKIDVSKLLGNFENLLMKIKPSEKAGKEKDKDKKDPKPEEQPKT